MYLALLVLILALSAGFRIRTYLATREIYAVIESLKQVHIDATTEEQLVKLVPHLALQQTRAVNSGIARYYRVDVSNDYSHPGRWVAPLVIYFGRQPGGFFPAKSRRDFLPFPFNVEYVLGWRNLAFSASVSTLNGTVARISYGIEPDVSTPARVSSFVVARSVHAFWADRARVPVPVQSTDDDSPQYRFGVLGGQFSALTGADSAIGLVYTSDAPRDLVSHAFQVDLVFFWSIFGCESVRQVVPRFWEDRLAQFQVTNTRLNSRNPCPDEILAGRVRYLLDLNIALIEIADVRPEAMNYEGGLHQESVTDYRLKEVIRGDPQGPWTGVRSRPAIPWPSSPTGERANSFSASGHRGSKFLYFSGAKFDSCRIVPATDSALAAVRTAIPAPRHDDDDVIRVLGKRM